MEAPENMFRKKKLFRNNISATEKMPIIYAKYGASEGVFNADCSSDILLDALFEKAIKETEAFARAKDSELELELKEKPETPLQEAIQAYRAKQKAALVDGVQKFKGLRDSTIDLLDAEGKPLGLATQPKARASSLLTHKQTYTLAKQDGEMFVPLVFQLPSDDDVPTTTTFEEDETKEEPPPVVVVVVEETKKKTTRKKSK